MFHYNWVSFAQQWTERWSVRRNRRW